MFSSLLLLKTSCPKIIIAYLVSRGQLKSADHNGWTDICTCNLLNNDIHVHVHGRVRNAWKGNLNLGMENPRASVLYSAGPVWNTYA